MRRPVFAVLLVLSAIMLSGCSMMAPQYSASIENVQMLKDGGELGTKVGKFQSKPSAENANPISLRGSSLNSPYENSYAAYLAEAIKQELSLAGKLKAGTDVEISGDLLKNDIDATGFSVATGDVGARFVVKKGDQVRYDKVKTIHHQWDSSFAGAIAIPRAQQAYPGLVQRLLAALYADAEFIQALK
jgi:hypothetical protein